MTKPKRLSRGSRIEVVFPASPVRAEFFEPGIAYLRQMGFEVIHPPDVYRKWRYLAGTDERRREEFLRALKNSDSDAIFFARGGYGSSRILSDVREFQNINPKILLGCSDITSLHLYFQRIHNWIVFHGPMASGDFARDHVHLESFEKAILQSEPYALAPEGIQTLVPGSAEGVLTGGCLTLMEAAIGTPWEPDWKDAILFLEDVGTKPYQIDRMLTHLKILKKFDGVQAFIFGEMRDCIQTETQGYTLQEVLLDILGEFQKPVFFGFPSGHVTASNWTLPLGVHASVQTDPHFQLNILEGAVE